jgi:hypothetical protein
MCVMIPKLSCSILFSFPVALQLVVVVGRRHSTNLQGKNGEPSEIEDGRPYKQVQ